MRKKQVFKLGTVVLLTAMLCLSGCGGQKENLVGYDSGTGKTVEQMIDEKLNGTKQESAELDSEESGEKVVELPEEKPDTQSIDDKAKAILKEMTLEEKVYQMFIVTPEDLTGYKSVNASTDITKGKLKEYPVGGLIYFAHNLINKEQTTDMLKNTTKSAMELYGLPIFLCVDEEGGRVARVANNKSFGVENVGEMEGNADKEKAYNAGAYIGEYLDELGFNVNLAPVADVITNEKNKVIGARSFGTDANLVTECAVAYSDGLHSQNVLSTFKHFPGHGSTEGDTHEGYAYTNKSYSELKEAELLPFSKAKNAGVDFVMVSHISVPSVVGDNTPCTLSYKMVTEVLRGDLEYDGLIMTDGLNMEAITKNYSQKEAAVKTVQAGVDILLMPKDFHGAVEGILEAVKNGEISEDRINDSVLRIIKAKLKMKTE